MCDNTNLYYDANMTFPVSVDSGAAIPLESDSMGSSQHGAHLAVDGGQSDGSEGSFDETEYDASPGGTQILPSVEDQVNSDVPFIEGLERLEEKPAPPHHSGTYAASSFGDADPAHALFSQNLASFSSCFTAAPGQNGSYSGGPVNSFEQRNPAFSVNPHGIMPMAGHGFPTERLRDSPDNEYLAPDDYGHGPKVAPKHHSSFHSANDGESTDNGSHNESPTDSTEHRKKPVVKTNYATPPDMTARLAASTSSESSAGPESADTEEEEASYFTFIDPDVPDFIPKMSDLLNVKHSNVDKDTIFENVDEANRLASLENIPKDNTIPRSHDQRKAIVKALCNAVKSTEHAEDNPGMIRPFAEGKYSARRIEVLAWNILHTCVVRHTTGNLLGPFEVKRKQVSDLPTFAERMAKILECLTTQKTICKHLLDPYYLFQFVDDPVASQKRVLANKNLNKRKGDIMNAGKRMMSKSSIAGSPQSKIDDSFASETPSSFGPSHDMTPASNLDLNDPDRTITPDATFNENMMARNYSSSASSPAARRASLNMGRSNLATPYHVPRNTTQQPSPSPAPKSAAAAQICKFHDRRRLNLAAQRRAQNARTPSHSRGNSLDGSLTTSFYFPNDEQHHTAAAGMPGPRPRAESTSTTASQKRRASEVDDVEENPSPNKRR